ncbi:MAG: GNAT family N-acetyltransferase [Thermoplasmatota archaeon]
MEGDGPVSDDIEIIHTSEWPTEEIVELYKAGGWWKDSYDPSRVQPLLKGSAVFIIIYHKVEKRAVGMGRLVSDGVSDGYIQDLVVLPHLRGRGIGRMMVRELVRSARELGLVWIGLISEEGKNGFYERLGFKTFSGTPMIYDPDGEV